jgi:hypothetical protein
VDFSYVISNLGNALTFAQGCSLNVRTNNGDIPIFKAKASGYNFRSAVPVYSGDSNKGLIVAIAAFALFSGQGILSTIGFVSLALAATTFQVSYRDSKVSEAVKGTKVFWW